MSIDFKDTNKLIDKIRFYVEFDVNNDDDLVLLNDVIKEIKERDENSTNN